MTRQLPRPIRRDSPLARERLRAHDAARQREIEAKLAAILDADDRALAPLLEAVRAEDQVIEQLLFEVNGPRTEREKKR